MDLSTMNGGGIVVLGSAVPIASSDIHYVAADSTEYLATGNIETNVSAYPDTPSQLQFVDFFGTQHLTGPETIRSSNAYPYMLLQNYASSQTVYFFDNDFNSIGNQSLTNRIPTDSVPHGLCAIGTNYYVLNDKQNISKFVGSFTVAATHKSISAQCPKPVDIAADSNKVYVLDSISKSIYIFDENLNYTGLSWAINAEGLTNPTCINVYADSLYVYDNSSKQIYTFPKTGGGATSKTMAVSDYVGGLYGFIMDATLAPIVLSAYPAHSHCGIGRVAPAIGNPQPQFMVAGRNHSSVGNTTGVSFVSTIPYFVRIK